MGDFDKNSNVGEYNLFTQVEKQWSVTGGSSKRQEKRPFLGKQAVVQPYRTAAKKKPNIHLLSKR